MFTERIQINVVFRIKKGTRKREWIDSKQRKTTRLISESDFKFFCSLFSQIDINYGLCPLDTC